MWNSYIKLTTEEVDGLLFDGLSCFSFSHAFPLFRVIKHITSPLVTDKKERNAGCFSPCQGRAVKLLQLKFNFVILLKLKSLLTGIAWLLLIDNGSLKMFLISTQNKESIWWNVISFYEIDCWLYAENKSIIIKFRIKYLP